MADKVQHFSRYTIHADCPDCWCRDGDPCSCRCHNHDSEGDESPRGWDADDRANSTYLEDQE